LIPNTLLRPLQPYTAETGTESNLPQLGSRHKELQ
jgi:hypothetical protein